MTYLFLFTHGPVQGFIAQARKTRDLEAGSIILSELTREAIKTLAGEVNKDPSDILVYPAWSESGASMPNKFLAMIEGDDMSLQQIGRNIESAVRSYFSSISEVALQNLSIQKEGEYFRKAFEDQVNNHLEIFWVFEPLKGTYFDSHNRIISKLGAIKNCRLFKQLPEWESGRKCSVSGERDALVFGAGFEYGRRKEEYPAFVNYRRAALTRKDEIQIEKGEGLSAVVAIKRFFQKDSIFLPTAGFAALDFTHAVENNGAALVHLRKYQTYFKKKWDEQLLYLENLTENYFEKQGLAHLIAQLDEIKFAHRVLFDAVQKVNEFREKEKLPLIPGLSSYYALLQFDGDNMGATWSGVKLKDPLQLQAFQIELAQKLLQFSREAREYLDEQPRGSTVYSGGDDFTGFINLSSVFDILGRLRKRYREIVHEPLAAFLKPNEELSFSAGLVIAHYKTPLGEVVRTAHRAQGLAKEEAGRDAFAITVLKRSGEIQEAYMKWEEDCINLGLLETITHGLKSNQFSNTFIINLQEELFGLAGLEKADVLTDLDPIITIEIPRLVKRSGQKAFLPEDPQERKVIITEFGEAVKKLYFASYYGSSVENFMHFLHISDFLHRQPNRA